jgi:hypothetical protein
MVDIVLTDIVPQLDSMNGNQAELKDYFEATFDQIAHDVTFFFPGEVIFNATVANFIPIRLFRQGYYNQN